MGIGTSIFLIAVGAILDFAVKVNTPGFNLNTIGVILMVVGAIGVILSMVFWSSWGGFNSAWQPRVAPVAPSSATKSF